MKEQYKVIAVINNYHFNISSDHKEPKLFDTYEEAQEEMEKISLEQYEHRVNEFQFLNPMFRGYTYNGKYDYIDIRKVERLFIK
jgi:hypothetical protein